MRAPSPELIAALPGSPYASTVRRALYSTDASIYQQMPVAVVVPRDRDEILATLEAARRFGVPVLPRGGATSLAGQTTGEAIVLDLTPHHRRVLDLDIAGRRARVEPGVVRDTLNDALRPHGLMFAPETSTSNRATLGGMIANNSSGANSVRHGRTSDHVASLVVALAGGEVGEVRTLAALPATSPLRGAFDELLRRVAPHEALLRGRWPRVPRRVGGYGLDELIDLGGGAADGAGFDPHLARFLAGSEGTLAVFLEAEVGLVPVPRHLGVVALHAADQLELLRAVPALRALDPMQIELVDRPLVEMARRNPAGAPLCGWIEGTPEALLFVEVDGESAAQVAARLEEVERVARDIAGVYHLRRAADAAERAAMIELRKLALGLLQRMPGDAKPISFIEDACVPVEHLAAYIGEAQQWCRDEGLAWVCYGHASVGVLHFKPILDLRREEHLAAMERLADRAVARVRELGGCWSGEHGDGIMRGARNRAFWGDTIYDLFREVKRAFDPRGLLNPGKIIDTPALTERSLLRYAPGYRATWDATWFHFRREGGFHAAVEMCNGTGVCRKVGAGTMCPSFMATRDESDTTRGRANALRLAMSGQLGPGAMTADALAEVLDLCLECKACRTECPSNVDMARMKSEVLAARRAERGASWRDLAFGEVGRWARWGAGPAAPVINAIARSGVGRAAAARWLGVARERVPPALARRRFSAWWRGRGAPGGNGGGGADAAPPDVLLFVDTYVEAFEPEMGRAFVAAAEALGARVGALAVGCCGRPLISKGLLREARARGTRLMRAIAATHPGVPIVVLEPSCHSALAEDLPDLLTDPAPGESVAPRITTAEEWLLRRLGESGVRGVSATAPDAAPAPPILLHPHCHQRAMVGPTPAARLIARLLPAGAPAPRVLDAGCCGLAGSFGYEAEHHELSEAIGRDRLAPAIAAAEADAAIVADGFSCRHQIAHLTGRRARHAVEIAAALLGAAASDDPHLRPGAARPIGTPCS